MAASDKITRRSDEVERERHIAASEAAAFATTAGAMLLGILAQAEAAQHHNEQHRPDAAAPPPHPADAAPVELTPADHGPQHQDQHASAIEAPAADSALVTYIDAGSAFRAPDPGAMIDAAPGGETVAEHGSVLEIPVWTFDAPAGHPPSAIESTGLGETVTPSSLDLGAPIHQLADTITGIIDTSLATVSHTLASLGTAVGQLTSSLSGTLGHLTDSLTGAVTNLIHDVPVATVIEPLATNLLGSTTTADSFGTSQHGASLLDTAGAIPTALLHPLPLQLGFLGQPTIDGHEMHDGAFSALGVHHF